MHPGTQSITMPRSDLLRGIVMLFSEMHKAVQQSLWNTISPRSPDPLPQMPASNHG